MKNNEHEKPYKHGSQIIFNIYTIQYKCLCGKRYQNKYRWGHLECPAGKYGNNCLQNCSENCYIAKTCDRKTGVCHKGCAVGWKLPFCNEGTCIFLSASTICSCFRLFITILF